MRFVGVDFGRRRIGVALSDASGLLAHPWRTLPAGDSPEASARHVAAALADLRDPLDDSVSVAGIVVGLPRRLDGRDNEATEPARALASALGALTRLEVHLQDERLSSHEAEQLLAEQEPDWRRRKARLDAAAAAVILQDFLDARLRARAFAERTGR